MSENSMFLATLVEMGFDQKQVDLLFCRREMRAKLARKFFF